MCAAAVAKARDLSMVIPSEPVVRIEELNHFYGHGASRSQVLVDNRIEIGPGHLVVKTQSVNVTMRCA